jgi:predicted Zn-dependent protease
MNSFIRKTLIVIVVMAFVAVAGWAGRKVYIRSTLHRLTADAGRYIDKQDYKQASLCLRQALTINSLDVNVNRLMADMLEETGSPAALGWRIRAVQLQTNNMEFRLAWAKTALKMNDLASANQALGSVDEKARVTAEYHKLRGALAWNVHLPAEAQKEYSEALRLEPTNQVVAMNLDTIGLASTNPAVTDQSRAALEKITTNSSLHLAATRFLIEDAAAHKSLDRALSFSQQVVGDSKATYADKLTHLQLLQAAKSPGMEAWLTSLETEAAHSPQHAYVLAHWMEKEKTPAVALKWLQGLPADCRTNVSVQLAVTDCQIATKDWKALLASVQKQDWEEFNYYRLSLEALANRNSGDLASAKSAWRRAVIMSSSRLDRLHRLDQLTTVWGWPEERIEVLKEVVSAFPKEAWAGEELVGLYYASGNTHALADLLDKLYVANPTSALLKNNLATVLMLLKSDTQKANRLALESYTSATNNPFFACTYAYSLLLQSKPEEAARIVGMFGTNILVNPSIAAYYGVVEAGAGHKTAAKDALKVAQSAKLLPEEIDMVRKAEARL